jgi:hypothetical protein
MSLDEKLKEIRKYRFLSTIMTITLPFLIILVSILATSVGIEDSTILYLAIPYGIAYLYFGIKFSLSNCPSCKLSMFRKGILVYGFNKCVNCNYHLDDAKAVNIEP